VKKRKGGGRGPIPPTEIHLRAAHMRHVTRKHSQEVEALAEKKKKKVNETPRGRKAKWEIDNDPRRAPKRRKTHKRIRAA